MLCKEFESAYFQAKEMDTLVALPTEFQTLPNARKGLPSHPLLHSRYYKMDPFVKPAPVKIDPIAFVRFPHEFATENAVSKLRQWARRKDAGVLEAWAAFDGDGSLCVIMRKKVCATTTVTRVLGEAYARTLRKFGPRHATPPDISEVEDNKLATLLSSLEAVPLGEFGEQAVQNPLLQAITGVRASKEQIEEAIRALQARIVKQRRPQPKRRKVTTLVVISDSGSESDLTASSERDK